MSSQDAALADPFIETKEYRRFAEFCDACRRYRYIGLCYGTPGVGKTLSARHYARWDLLEPLLREYVVKEARPKEVLNCRTLLYTPPVVNTTPYRMLCKGAKEKNWNPALKGTERMLAIYDYTTFGMVSAPS